MSGFTLNFWLRQKRSAGRDLCYSHYDAGSRALDCEGSDII